MWEQPSETAAYFYHSLLYQVSSLLKGSSPLVKNRSCSRAKPATFLSQASEFNCLTRPHSAHMWICVNLQCETEILQLDPRKKWQSAPTRFFYVHFMCACESESGWRWLQRGSPLLIPPELQPQGSPKPPSVERKRKWPNSSRKCCKVTSSSLQRAGDGILLRLCVSVCVCVRLWFVLAYLWSCYSTVLAVWDRKQLWRVR